jgi:hypothetical protein
VQAGLELLPALVLALAFLALAYPVLAARALREPLRLNPLRVNLCSAEDWALRDLEPALLALVVLRERLPRAAVLLRAVGLAALEARLAPLRLTSLLRLLARTSFRDFLAVPKNRSMSLTR